MTCSACEEMRRRMLAAMWRKLPLTKRFQEPRDTPMSTKDREQENNRDQQNTTSKRAR